MVIFLRKMLLNSTSKRIFCTTVQLLILFFSINLSFADTHKSFVGSIEQRLVEFVHNTVETLRYSTYKLGGTRIDPSRGIYVVDCSTYVDHVLESIYPDAYDNLVGASGSEKPTTKTFYNFFNRLAYDSNDYWNKIDNIEKLQPGDILVFRYKNSHGKETGGHVMVVMEKPTREDDDSFLIRVADSASSGHSEDTRRHSGIGIGTLLLKANPKTGHPTAYAWKEGSYWKHNVKFAMARPIDFTN